MGSGDGAERAEEEGEGGCEGRGRGVAECGGDWGEF